MHLCMVIFELVRPYDHRMNCPDIWNCAGVIVLTDKHTNRHYLK